MVLTTMKSEGPHEVEAARKRLAAAKARGTAASKAVESAQEMLDSARKIMAAAKKNKIAAMRQADASRNEIVAAETSLRVAERRWEVIDISEEPEEEQPVSKKRKKKTSVATTPTPRGSNNTNRAAATVAVTPQRSNDSRRASDPTNNVQQISIEGCGKPGVNGIYARSSSLCNGRPIYRKSIQQSNGSLRTHSILYLEGYWYINYDGAQGGPLYMSHYTGRCSPPPEESNKWELHGAGAVLPRPQLKLQ